MIRNHLGLIWPQPPPFKTHVSNIGGAAASCFFSSLCIRQWNLGYVSAGLLQPVDLNIYIYVYRYGDVVYTMYS